MSEGFDERRTSNNRSGSKRSYSERSTEQDHARTHIPYQKRLRCGIDDRDVGQDATVCRNLSSRSFHDDEAVPSTSRQALHTDYRIIVTNPSDTEMLGGYPRIEADREETDLTPCEEDQFTVDNVQGQSTEAKEEEPCYHPEQIEMAAVLKERMEEIIFRNPQSLRYLSAYQKFEFVIYTAKSKMLEEQTISRLCDAGTECFPRSIYNLDADTIYRKAQKKVWKFSVENIEKVHKKLVEEVKRNQDTLYLIVADEAHSAITKETTQKKEEAANNTVVNSWDAEKHPNVVVLQVTATPFNLLTRRSRIPHTVVARPINAQVSDDPTPEECDDKKLTETGRKLKNVSCGGRGSHKLYVDRKDVTVEYSLPVKLHHVKWSEQLMRRIASANGVVLRIQVPADRMRWLSFRTESYKTFEAITSTDVEEEATEFLFQGEDGVVTIHTVDKKWQLVVHDHKDDFGRSRLKVECLNLRKHRPAEDIDGSFRMLLEYGEDIFQLEGVMSKLTSSLGQSTRKSVRFNTGKLELGMRDNADEYTVTSLIPSSTSHSFFIDTRRNVCDTKPNAGYVSLNTMFNSMRFEDRNQHRLRHDSVFEDICKHVRALPNNSSWVTVHGNDLSASSLTDVYAAVLAYWILVVENVELLEQSMEFNSFDECLDMGLHKYQERYTNSHSLLTGRLEKELSIGQRQSQDYFPIRPEIFRAVKQFYANTARKELSECLHERLPGRDRHKSYVNRVWQALALCILHMDKFELIAARREMLSFGDGMKDAQKKKELLNKTFKEEFYDYFEVEHVLEQDESCKFASDLIHPFRREQSGNVKGQLKIVKVLGIQDGNRLYKTVCIARKVAQERLDYTFEVLRDYGTFDITSVNKECHGTEPLFRVRRKLQPEQCEFRHENGQRCKCEQYVTSGFQLRCTSDICRGKHKHRKVRQYEDMRNLSGLLILLKKGRLGDTFPDTFTTLDLRITTAKKPENFAVITQDLGRMCRYVKERDKVPTALLGSGLYNILKASLNNQAVFHGPFIVPPDDNGQANGMQGSGMIPLDNHCKWSGCDVDPDVTSFDFDNVSKSKHHNRILLEAEPQIGKTGVYLRLISVLRKLINSVETQEDTDEEEIVFEEPEMEANQDLEITTDVHTWKLPYWRDMLSGPPLPKRLVEARSIPFEHNCVPPFSANQQSDNTHLTRIAVGGSTLKDSHYLAHTARHSAGNCQECKNLQYSTARAIQYNLNGKTVEISVPNHEYFEDVHDRLQTPTVSRFTPDISSGAKLHTWIFTAVMHGRCRKGYLNLRHTMVDASTRQLTTVPYIHVLVVNEDEFEEYKQQWRSTHAIVKRPEATGNISNGDAGLCRKFIQEFALSLGLDRIFVIDDNIPYVYTCVIQTNENEALVRNCATQSLAVRNIPLFDVLKAMEAQFDNSLTPPAVAYDPYSTCSPNMLSAYTGPSDQYAVLGICNTMKSQARVRKGFEKSHLSSLILLNLKALKAKQIEYQPWYIHSDYQLNVDADVKGLWVCRYNRYVMAKSVASSHNRNIRLRLRRSTTSDTEWEVPGQSTRRRISDAGGSTVGSRSRHATSDEEVRSTEAIPETPMSPELLKQHMRRSDVQRAVESVKVQPNRGRPTLSTGYDHEEDAADDVHNNAIPDTPMSPEFPKLSSVDQREATQSSAAFNSSENLIFHRPRVHATDPSIISDLHSLTPTDRQVVVSESEEGELNNTNDSKEDDDHVCESEEGKDGPVQIHGDDDEEEDYNSESEKEEDRPVEISDIDSEDLYVVKFVKGKHQFPKEEERDDDSESEQGADSSVDMCSDDEDGGDGGSKGGEDVQIYNGDDGLSLTEEEEGGPCDNDGDKDDDNGSDDEQESVHERNEIGQFSATKPGISSSTLCQICEVLRGEKAKLNEQNEGLQSENVQCNAKIIDLVEENKELREENSKLLKEKIDRNDSVIADRDEMRDLRVKFARAMKEIEQLKLQNKRQGGREKNQN